MLQLVLFHSPFPYFVQMKCDNSNWHPLTQPYPAAVDHPSRPSSTKKQNISPQADIDVTNATSHDSASISSDAAISSTSVAAGESCRPVKRKRVENVVESVETAVHSQNVHVHQASSFTNAVGAGGDGAVIGGLDIPPGDITSGLWNNFPPVRYV